MCCDEHRRAQFTVEEEEGGENPAIEASQVRRRCRLTTIIAHSGSNWFVNLTPTINQPTNSCLSVCRSELILEEFPAITR